MCDLFSISSLPGTQEYEVVDEIGHGTYGDVYQARHRQSGEMVALKHVVYMQEGVKPAHLIRETQALSALKNSGKVVKLRETYEQTWSACLVLDCCDTSLAQILDTAKDTPLPSPVIKAISKGVFSALKEVHAAGVMHRDISPSNVLINRTGHVYLSDFGQARFLDSCMACLPACSKDGKVHECKPQHRTSEGCIMESGSAISGTDLTPTVGTRWYRAPELLFGARRYGTAVDMWSAGCIFAEILFGKPLFPGGSDIDQICRIRNVLGSPTEERWPRVAELPDWGKLVFPPKDPSLWEHVLPKVHPDALSVVEKLLRYDPKDRATAHEVLASKYFKNDSDAACSDPVSIHDDERSIIASYVSQMSRSM